MEETARIHAEIQAYYGGMTGAHHRYRSWEHCYSPEHVASDHDHTALQLAFYLASWGCTVDRASFLNTIIQSISRH
jgi:hypothetical protein